MSTQATSQRVPGHELRNEGRAFDHGFRVQVGHARCSCGGRSPELASDAARKRWHREHKAAMLEQQRAGR